MKKHFPLLIALLATLSQAQMPPDRDAARKAAETAPLPSAETAPLPSAETLYKQHKGRKTLNSNNTTPSTPDTAIDTIKGRCVPRISLIPHYPMVMDPNETAIPLSERVYPGVVTFVNGKSGIRTNTPPMC